MNGLKNLLFSNTSEVALRRQGKVLPPRLENRQGSTGSHGSGEQRLTMGTSAGTAQLGLIDGQRRLKIPGRSCCRVIPPFCEFYFWEPHQVLIEKNVSRAKKGQQLKIALNVDKNVLYLKIK